MIRRNPLWLLLALLILIPSFLFGQYDLFRRAGTIPMAPIENSGWGNMIGGVDLDKDGKPEIYTVNNDWNDTGNELIPRIYKYELDSAKWKLVWSATLNIPLQNTWPALTYGDWDGDGKMEVIWGPVNNTGAGNPNPPRIVVFEDVGDGSDNMGVPDGSGGWKPNAEWTIVTTDNYNLRPFRWQLTDIDNDGKPELVFVSRVAGERFGIVSVSDIPDNGDGSETWTMKKSGLGETINSSTLYDMAVIDSTLYLLHNNGTVTPVRDSSGTWTIGPEQANVIPGGPWKSASVVDLDGDGTKEIVVAGGYNAGTGGATNNKAYVVQKSGDTLMATMIADFSSLSGTGGRPMGTAYGDIDNDGKLDFVFGSRDATPNAAIVRLRYKGGAITSPANYESSLIDANYSSGGRWDLFAIFNADSDADQEVFYTDGIGPDTPTGPTDPIIILERVSIPSAPITLGAARIDANKDGLIDRIGDTVRVIGIVNSLNIQTTNFGYFMQDETGGLEIFKSGLAGAPTLAPGYRVLVYGKLDQYRGTAEVVPFDYATDIMVLDTGNTVTSFNVTIGQYKANPELYESRRLTLTLAQPLDFTSAQWPAAGSSPNLNIWDGIDTLILRLDSDTPVPGSPYPTFPVHLTGVASQFTTVATKYDDGYQITPMFPSDFVPFNAPPVAKMYFLEPANNSRIVLNDTAQTITFRWKAALDFNGDQVIYQWFPVGKAAVPTGNAAKDTFLVRTGKQIRDAYLLTADSVVLKWTVAAKDPTNAAVFALDTMSVTFVRGAITEVSVADLLPTQFNLQQNYPNPFNPTTTIRFGLPSAAQVSVKIYDELGREVSQLVNEVRAAGYYDAVWNGTNNSGSRVASGVYFYRMTAQPIDGSKSFVELKKMILLK